MDIVDLECYSDTSSSLHAIFTVSLFCAEVSTCSHVSELDPIHRSQVDPVRFVRALVTGEVEDGPVQQQGDHQVFSRLWPDLLGWDLVRLCG